MVKFPFGIVLYPQDSSAILQVSELVQYRQFKKLITTERDYVTEQPPIACGKINADWEIQAPKSNLRHNYIKKIYSVMLTKHYLTI